MDNVVIPKEAWQDMLRAFFGHIFNRCTVPGYVCVAMLPRDRRMLKERFFSWPDQLEDLIEYVIGNSQDHNAYFCPQLLGSKARDKKSIVECPVAWADLDECPPEQLLVPPSVVIETSYQRYQALWRFERPVQPADAETLSRKIAYAHADDGVDRSGWDLSQLLRVPGTTNLKRSDVFRVEIRNLRSESLYRIEDFTAYKDIHVRPKVEIPVPGPDELPKDIDALELLEKYRRSTNPRVFKLYSSPPEENEFQEGWSGALWKLIMLLYEGGLDREEVFLVCQSAACNKYTRDGRSDTELWNDVVRGYFQHQEHIKTPLVPELVHVDLLTSEEIDSVKDRETFLSRYIKWASGLGDAAQQYHEAGAFIILSALLAGKVILPTSFGNIVPNLWFMILADTTITRKSTAMDIAIDLLIEVDPDAIMATDGSIEGLLSGLSTRPGRPSIFLRDEFTGLLEAITKKDYMAGMAETLTKLYDGKYSKRILRKETVEIKDPVLILFAGGIRNRVQQLLTLDHVSSGFMPRFVYITAESDVTNVKPMGPPIVRDLTERQKLLDEMEDIHAHYNSLGQPAKGIKIGPPSKISAQLSERAWLRFNKFEAAMLKAGIESERPDLLTPVYDRLGKSVLKAAVLLAASEQRDSKVIVGEVHILHAMYFAQRWREYAVEVINGVGKSSYERDIERLLDAIKRRPGVSRSSLMQAFHLTAQSANALFSTLEQRGLITSNKFGKGTNFWVVGYKPPEEEEDQDGGQEPQRRGIKVR